MRLTPLRLLLYNLEGKIPSKVRRGYIPPEEAYRRLKELTGQDYGMDAKEWRKHVKEKDLRFPQLD
jgi:hypothetical protein